MIRSGPTYPPQQDSLFMTLHSTLRPPYLSILWAALIGLFLATNATAQTDSERASARAAAIAGGEAFQAGDFKRSLDLFRRAESLPHSPVHELYAARSLVRLGRLVEAREQYMKRFVPLPGRTNRARSSRLGKVVNLN